MKVLMALLFLLSAQAIAMYGDLLPLEMAPDHACRVSLNNGSSTCSGTIVSPTVLKTASHCLRNKKLSETKVVCPNGEEFGAEEFILHPDYYEVNNRMLADVGLIVLDRPYKEEIPPFLDERAKIRKLMENSPICAIWSYGYNIKNLKQLGHYHGVALSEFSFDQSHVIISNSHRVMIRSGDSGGGLFCLDGDNQWINVATVYGHDYNDSFVLRNDYVRPFLKENGLTSRQISYENPGTKPPKYKALDVKSGKKYAVRPFSVVQRNNEREFGIGDQKKAHFKVTSHSATHATGTLTIQDIAPVRYMCTDNILCHGVYENVKISTRRLIKPNSKR